MSGSDSSDDPIAPYRFLPYLRSRTSEDEMLAAARRFLEVALERRTIRSFSPDPVPQEIIDLAIRAASSAPSGANMQPWTFVVVRDPETKRKIREAAEEEERINYSGRMSDEWLAALAPLGTDEHKEFLEIAPALIVVFRQDYHLDRQGNKVKHYYVTESVGIAAGFLLAALNWAGLATLTHTPSPMGFLREILDRPVWERPFLLIPVGYPAEGCEVPDIEKKSIDDVRIVR